ncbi:hypothetical protein [Pelagibacterium sp.]|uniref:hypothetical protein n=1 Tax=Pelagibacterium sp. TaxID=1967288 RepID=UPI003BA92295
MSAKEIISVGMYLNTDLVEQHKFTDRISLLDADIVLFVPNMEYYHGHYDGDYLGRPCLNDTESFKLKEFLQHWRREIRQCMDAGKTVLIFLSNFHDVYVATGQVSHSGTGRNRATTRHVEKIDNYGALPKNLKPTPTDGHKIVLTPAGSEILKEYWDEFADFSSYLVTLAEGQGVPLAHTQSGGKLVACMYPAENGKGALICLPYLETNPDSFEDENGEWTEESARFAAKLINTAVSLDRKVKASTEETPAPDWSLHPDFLLRKEQEISEQISTVEGQILRLEEEISVLIQKRRECTEIKGLLYEKGKALEKAVLSALGVLGFAAENFVEGALEIDAVFVSTEGRFIGEVEGKDSKAVSIEKLRQLSMNIHEDLQREEVSESAKPVLFGNAYRLSPPQDRQQNFTDKCLNVASTTNVALEHV